MLKDIIAANALGCYRLHLRFGDKVEASSISPRILVFGACSSKCETPPTSRRFASIRNLALWSERRGP
jgi:hypothetical protein